MQIIEKGRQIMRQYDYSFLRNISVPVRFMTGMTIRTTGKLLTNCSDSCRSRPLNRPVRLPGPVPA